MNKNKKETNRSDLKLALKIVGGSIGFIVLVCIHAADHSTPKEILFLFARWLFEFAFCYTIIFTIVFMVSLFKRKIKGLRMMFYIGWCVALLLCIPHLPRVFGYGTTQIGSFYEYREYTENYVVTMSRHPKSKSNRKVYTLPATISRMEDYVGSVTHRDHDGGEYEKDIYELAYFLDYIYFDNGEYLYFSESAEETPLVVGEEVELKDYHGDTYYVKLTDKMYIKALQTKKKK